MAGLITVRQATDRDQPELYAELARGDREIVDLGRSLVLVAKTQGRIAGFIAARQITQVEPLLLTERMAWRPPHLRRRVTLTLARAMDAVLSAGEERCYYAAIADARFQRLASHFGLRPVYGGRQWFLREFPED